nr:MAG: RNA-dependent RNA polymerase [Streptophyte associated narna-like virus 17]
MFKWALLGRLVGQSPTPNCKNSRKKTSHRRIIDSHTAVWQAVWAGFVASGISQEHGCWVFRSWVTKSGPRGVDWICDKVKDLSVSLRDVCLTDREVNYVEEVPKNLQRWLRRKALLSPRVILAFTRCARGLPKASASRISVGLYNHAISISESISSSDVVCRSIEDAVAVKFGNSLRKQKWKYEPSSKNAVRESPGSKGGYDEYLRNLITEDLHGDLYRSEMEGRILEAARRSPPFPGKDSLLNRLLKIVRAGPFDELMYPEVLQGYGTLLSMENFFKLGKDYDNMAIHVAAPISEQGCKVRVITVPPAGVFTAGTLARKTCWSILKKKDPRIADFEKRLRDDGFVNGFMRPLRGDQQILSADLTKATDGFSHNAIRAVVRGMGRAGLSPLYTETILQSLGVGDTKHYVRYHRKSFTEKQWLVVSQLARSSVNPDEKFVDVPMNRGCLMGTPFSFTILSLLNGWACEALGTQVAICGDDVLAVCTQKQVDSYRIRVTDIGSGLHDKKSFFGKKGWTFCEVFGLYDDPAWEPSRWFNPYPIKQFMRDGNGVMDKGKYFAPQWKALRRVARVLCKGVRAKARRLGRPPELPASLGGLGHPSKGMRDMPKIVRSQLYELVIGQADPSKFAKRIDVFYSPADPRQFEMVRNNMEAGYDSDIVHCTQEPPLGSCFVPNRVLRAHIASVSHRLYWALGGTYRPCLPKAMKPGRLKLPPPSSRQFDRRTPWTQVQGYWREKLDEEGKHLPIDFAREIRGFTPTHGELIVRQVPVM